MNALPASTHRSAAVATLALTVLLAACNVGPGATSRPTTGPSTPPTTSGPTPTPTPTPSPTPVPSPTFRPDQIEHPTGANDIILRMEQGGGFVPINFLVTQAPTFTLYGDGTVIFQQVDTRGAPFGEVANLPWLVGQLDEEGIQSLLQYALSTGRLANARENYDNPMIADAPTTTFNLNAGGKEKVVQIYALSEMTDPGPDAADRAGFLKLSQALSNFESQTGLGEVTPYDAESYRVTLLEGFGEPVGEPLAWPWEDLTTDSFAVLGDEPGGIAILDREHVAKLLAVPNGGHPGLWVVAPDDELVQLGVRPLLPDEIVASES